MTLTNKLVTSITMIALLAVFATPVISFADHGGPHYNVQFVAFEDINDDGVQLADEPGVEGVTVTLSSSDGEITLDTDENGFIVFENIPSEIVVLSVVNIPAHLVPATNSLSFPLDVDVDHNVTWPALGLIQGIPPPPNDEVPPVITVIPNEDGDIDFDLLMGETYVEFGATATDDIDGPIESENIVTTGLVDTTSSGSYVVTYTVYDVAGNEATESRIVTVLTQQQALDKLEQEINDAITNGDIDSQGTALLSKLDQIMAKLDKDNSNAACNQLNAFINQIEGLRDSGEISISTANSILAAANGIHANYC